MLQKFSRKTAGSYRHRECGCNELHMEDISIPSSPRDIICSTTIPETLGRGGAL